MLYYKQFKILKITFYKEEIMITEIHRINAEIVHSAAKRTFCELFPGLIVLGLCVYAGIKILGPVGLFPGLVCGIITAAVTSTIIDSKLK